MPFYRGVQTEESIGGEECTAFVKSLAIKQAVLFSTPRYIILTSLIRQYTFRQGRVRRLIPSNKTDNNYTESEQFNLLSI